MFGNLIANRQLRRLVNSRDLDIDPFDDALLKATHYTLLPGRVLKRNLDGTWHDHRSFADVARYELEPNEYVIVEVRQRVRIHAEGIVGRFMTTSNHIEGGLLVIAGQVDHRYGTNEERLRFGVKNLLPCANQITREMRLVHVEFFDLRGITIDKKELSDVEQSLWANRRRDPTGHGPDYDKA